MFGAVLSCFARLKIVVEFQIPYSMPQSQARIYFTFIIDPQEKVEVS